jgi:leucyl/phenylalanyl-tRNA--protein transferase
MIPINTLLDAYRTGYFPMVGGGRLGWYSPQSRGVIPLDRFHVSRRLKRVVRQGQLQTSVNRGFRRVIAACASRPDDSGNWIDDEIVESYCALHEAGHAHSVEVWQRDDLVGGLYGVSLRGAFFGESMFHTETDASKVALSTLVARLRDREYRLLDIQWLTPHLSQFGAIEIPRREYMRRLAAAMEVDCSFSTSSSLTEV